ncbi:MAG: hypothetical protein HXY51_08380 [Nitrospirae bacterium]|nr:hypothetical protein [Nitrospirota bacterium]
MDSLSEHTDGKGLYFSISLTDQEFHSGSSQSHSGTLIAEEHGYGDVAAANM